MFKRTIAPKLKSFKLKEEGNFTIFGALLVPLCFAAGSLAIDFSNAIAMKTRIQNAADGAALATASQLAKATITEGEAKAYAENFFKGVLANETGFSAQPTATIVPLSAGTSTAWQVKVETTGQQPLTPLAKFLGQDTIHVKVSAVSNSSSETNNPLSMVLVIDRSGSMSDNADGSSSPWYCSYSYWAGLPICLKDSKLDALKKAVTNMVSKFDLLDPNSMFVRLGSVAYNDHVQDAHKLETTWVKSAVAVLANTLTASGGTDSSDAMKWAYDELSAPTEINEHLSKNHNNDPAKFIVFMTDGSNNYTSADTKTKATCDAAKADGMEIFSVAFQAPLGGQKLLKYCASGDDFYYNAQSADDLLDAFVNIGEKASDLAVRLTS